MLGEYSNTELYPGPVIYLTGLLLMSIGIEEAHLFCFTNFLLLKQSCGE
jgi:hypothetical protein